MISTTNYTSQIELLEKCTAIIQQVKKYIDQLNRAEDTLRRFNEAKHFDMIRIMNTQRNLEDSVKRFRYYTWRSYGFYLKHLRSLMYMADNGKISKIPVFGDVEKYFYHTSSGPQIFNLPVLTPPGHIWHINIVEAIDTTPAQLNPYYDNTY